MKEILLNQALVNQLRSQGHKLLEAAALVERFGVEASNHVSRKGFRMSKKARANMRKAQQKRWAIINKKKVAA